MFKGWKENIVLMNEKIGNIKREIETIKKTSRNSRAENYDK